MNGKVDRNIQVNPLQSLFKENAQFPVSGIPAYRNNTHIKFSRPKMQHS